MVSHFNLTWKSACLEILNYVSLRLSLVRCRVSYNLLLLYSSARGLQDRLSKRDKLLWYGGSGQA